MSTVDNNARNVARSLLKRYPFYIHIGTIFVVLILIILLGIGWVTRIETRKMVQQSAEQLFDHVGHEVAQQARLLRAPVESAVQFGAALGSMTQASKLEQRMAHLKVLVEILKTEQQIAAIYYAYPNGELFLVRPLRAAEIRAHFTAPAASAYIVQSIEQDGQKHRWFALDDNLVVLAEWSSTDDAFDPRDRPWYQQAIRSDKLIRTAPYVFASTGQLGRTVATRTLPEGVVVGADLRTETLSQALANYRVTASSELVISDETGLAFAYHDPSRIALSDSAGKAVLPRLGELSPVMAAISNDGMKQRSHIIEINGREWSVRVTPLITEASHDFLALATPLDELMADVYATQRFLLFLLLLGILLSLPIVWLVSRRIANQLNSLTERAAAIQRFDFRTEVPFKTSIREIFSLGRAMQQMQETIRKFLDVSTALAAERNFDALLGCVLQEIHIAADSDGGVIYLFDEESASLKPAAQRWADSAQAKLEINVALPFNMLDHPVVASARQLQAPSRIGVGTPRPEGLGYLDERYGSQAVEIIVLPLLGRTGNMVGVVCNFIAPGRMHPSPERMALVQAFASAAAVAIDQQRLLLAQKTLLNAIVTLVAGAIDAKSPYTGGHCQRVPELTEMLAKAAHESSEMPFADFRMNEDQWEALHLAAWLHDCGKVTTPEYVVDKATKLETIYNRIHEIRMRVEVIKRDREISALKAILAGGDASGLNEKLRLELQELDEDYQFLAACNEGGEFMSPDKIERLKTIANRTWQRTLDDRIGLSKEEASRLAQGGNSALPVTEHLLADKPEHIVPRSAADQMPDDNPWGFKLTEPEHLYNRGELYNLSISRGTLSEEERYKINHHIVQTIMMLSKLPFPQHLKQVVELAGGHHEKMDGTGYPRRLRGEEMSLPARIMAIADIFEALTATDRPYKPAKKLSEAIKIMSFMVKDQHIDPALFKLFLTSGVYRQYAEKYLRPELVDEVDLAAYI